MSLSQDTPVPEAFLCELQSMPQLLNNFVLHQYALGDRVWAAITRYNLLPRSSNAEDAACSAYNCSAIMAWNYCNCICYMYAKYFYVPYVVVLCLKIVKYSNILQALSSEIIPLDKFTLP